MIELSDLLAPQRLDCKCDIKSKKKAIQTVAELLGAALKDPPDDTEGRDNDESSENNLSEMDFLDALVAREKLGSTGLGHGVSIPHGRIKGLQQPFASLITLADGIDYEAPDDKKVDIVMGLVVPEQCNDEHLQILASLAKVFSVPAFRDALRNCESVADLTQVLSQHDATVAGQDVECGEVREKTARSAGE